MSRNLGSWLGALATFLVVWIALQIAGTAALALTGLYRFTYLVVAWSLVALCAGLATASGVLYATSRPHAAPSLPPQALRPSPPSPPRFCRHCGAPLQPAARFCAHCGARLGDIGSRAPARPALRAFLLVASPLLLVLLLGLVCTAGRFFGQPLLRAAFDRPLTASDVSAQLARHNLGQQSQHATASTGFPPEMIAPYPREALKVRTQPGTWCTLYVEVFDSPDDARAAMIAKQQGRKNFYASAYVYHQHQNLVLWYVTADASCGSSTIVYLEVIEDMR